MIENITMKAWIAGRKPKVKGSSLKTYKSYERAHILPFWGDTLLTEVSGRLTDFKKYLAQSLAPKTVRDILNYLHTLLHEAGEKGLLTVPDMPKVTVEPKEKEILTYSEQKALSERLKPSVAPLDTAVLLAVSTGLRLGEIAGLRLKDIDLEAGVLTVRKNSQRVYDQRTGRTQVKSLTPKTKRSRRDIPLHRGLAEYLARCLAPRAGENKNAPLIKAPGGKAYDARTIERRFDRLKAEQDLSPGVTFHSLRHSFATRALETGADMRGVADLLGHSSVAFTMSCYSHCVTKQKREQMEKIAECF